MPRSVLIRPLPALLGVLALGAVLRLAWIGERSLWQDELFTARIMRGSFGDVLEGVAATEGTPPLYYVLAWPWARVLGDGEAALRVFPAVTSILVIGVAYLVGRRLDGPRLGLAAALLCAVSPPLVWHAQDARAYALAALLIGLSFLAMLVVRDSGGRGRAVAGWALAASAALCTHYLCALAIAGQAAWLLGELPAARRRVVAATAGVGAVGLALVPLFVRQADRAGATINADPLLGRALAAPAEWVVGYQAPWSRIGVAVAGCAIVAVAVWGLLRTDARERRALRPAAVVAAATVALPLLLAVAVHDLDFFGGRSVIIAWLPAGVLLAGGFVARRAGRAGPVALVALCSLSVVVVLASAGRPKFDRFALREIFATAGAGEPGGPRALVGTRSRAGLGYYGRGREMRTGTARVREVATYVVADAPTLGAYPRPERPPSPPPPPGFRFVARHETDTFTLVRYRSPRPVELGVDELRSLTLARRTPRLLILDGG